MKINAYYVVKKPILTEESTILMHSKNQYVFRVDPRANKSQIRDAVEEIDPACPQYLKDASRVVWTDCVQSGRQHGYRNAQP